jgi:SAM-dependent methyltransferase
MPESLSFDRVADQYDATRGYPPDVAEAIAEAILRAGRLAPGSDALEIGIGTGRIALPLLAKGVNVYGVDISQRMLDQLRQKQAALAAQDAHSAPGSVGTLQVEMADMTALPFPDARFAAVVAVHVFHLVPEWLRALDEALRVLRHDGALLIGQDVHSGPGANRAGAIEDHWREIVRELGYDGGNVGASGYQAALEELARRGLHVEEATAARWETQYTPRQALETITSRLWSRTWLVPDDLFAESARRLTAWGEQEFAGAMETPIAAPHAFKLARATR